MGEKKNKMLKKRLDSFLMNEAWQELFPLAFSNNLPRVASDYSVIVLHCLGCSDKERRKRPFCFQSMWLQDSDFNAIVNDAWTD